MGEKKRGLGTGLFRCGLWRWPSNRSQCGETGYSGLELKVKSVSSALHCTVKMEREVPFQLTKTNLSRDGKGITMCLHFHIFLLGIFRGKQ